MKILLIALWSSLVLAGEYDFTGLTDTGKEILSESTLTPNKVKKLCKSYFGSSIEYGNPYTEVGNCGILSIDVSNILSATSGFGYYAPPFKRTRYRLPIMFEIKSSNMRLLSTSSNYQGLFKVTGTEQISLSDGSTITAIKVIEIAK